MEIAYLGLFEKIADWVFSNLLGPVFNFVSDLLTTVLGWLFENVLAPVLIPVLEDAVGFFLDLWMTVASTWYYMLLSGLLKLIDYLQTAFDTFIGLRDVTYINGNEKITGPLLEVLFQQKTISTLFWALTLGGLAIALILTIIATARSAFDLDFENKRPVSRVLSAFFKTFISLFSIPFFAYFILKLSMVILKGIAAAMGSSGGDSLSRMIFVIVSMNAAKNDKFNLSSENSILGGALGTSTDTVRYPFYTGQKQYWKISEVTEVFNLADFDYLIGFMICFFLVFTLAVCLIIFIQRVFEVLLLYVVSPYFVAMMPLDDGEKFSRWREIFIAKCFSGFGSVIGMRLYIMLLPIVMGNTIQFELGSSQEAAYFLKLFFMAGGAWAVYKMGPMITSLLSYQAGQSEAMTGNIVGGALFGATAGAAIRHGKMAVSRRASQMGSSLKGKIGQTPGTEGKMLQTAAEREKAMAFRGGGRPGGGRTGGSVSGSRSSRSLNIRNEKNAAGNISGKPVSGLYKTIDIGQKKGDRNAVPKGLVSADFRRRSNMEGKFGYGRSSLGIGGAQGIDRKFIGSFIQKQYDGGGRGGSSFMPANRMEDGSWHVRKTLIPGMEEKDFSGKDERVRFSGISIPGALRVDRTGAEPESGRIKTAGSSLSGSYASESDFTRFASYGTSGGKSYSWKDEAGGKSYSYVGFKSYKSGWADYKKPIEKSDMREGGTDPGYRRTSGKGGGKDKS